MSSFEIVPNSITVLPGDKQALRLRVTSLAPLWQGLTNATVNAARELTPTNPTLNFGGYSGHLLTSGSGSVTYPLTAGSIPPAGGFSGGNIQDIDVSVYIGWLLDGTAGTLAFYNEIGTIFSMAYVPVVGDTITLEASGSIWRGYLNGVEKASYTPATGIDYPCFWTASMNAPLPASPLIPPPIMVGEWTSLVIANWDTPAHGNLATATGDVNEYRNGTVPGTYQIKARYAGSALQEAVAEVVIPPLMLAMPSAISARPSERIELLTNYDKAQTALVTWTALDGGTLNGNEYFAPTPPGNYRLRAAVGQQRVLTTITVPVVIQPAPTAGQKKLCAVGKALSLQLETNLPAPTWSCIAGSITAGGLYTAPISVGADRVTVTSGALSKTIIFEIVEVFPVDPTYGYSVETAKTVVINRTEDDEPYGRVKAPQNQPRRRYELKFENANLTELALVEDFWNRHFPQRKFIYDDKLRGEKVCCFFDSQLKYEPTSECDVAFSFRLIEA